MKKKALSLVLSSAMVLSLAGCGGKTDEGAAQTSTETETESTEAAGDAAEADTQTESSGNPVEINVTTTFAGEDGNAQNFKNAVDQWCQVTGNTVADTSATSDETFKTRVITDFETGSEPDVLFFFNGADANSFIEAGKVVPIDEIRAEYSDYASNMNDDLIADSLVDGKKYAVPVNGYWEAMFVNTEILDAAGVAMPGTDYSWDQFMTDCQKIKDAGYTPIACALGNIPHYWWEFCIFNNTGVEHHLEVPADVTSELGEQWVDGMEDIKALYEAGYFPENTLSATDDETFAMFTEGKAAFLIDGSWKVGGIVNACQADPDDPSTLDTDKLAKFDVTYVPAKDARKASDLIGGLSMGYYITRKAWDDPEKRDAAVSFVNYMTSDKIVPIFAQHTATALKNAPEVDESTFNPLQVKAMKMMSGVTSLTGAVQDLFQGDCRVSTFDGMPEIVTGKVNAVDAVAEGLDAYNAQ